MKNDYFQSKINLFAFKNIFQLCNKKLNSLIKILTKMNKSLLHKETGDKESARRGKYLNRLLHQAALGPNRPMQLNIGVGEHHENPDAYDKAAGFQQSPSHPYDYS